MRINIYIYICVCVSMYIYIYMFIYTHMSNPNKSVFWGESYILNQNNFRSCLKIQEPKLKVPQRLWSSSKYLGDRDREPWRFVDSFPSIPVIGDMAKNTVTTFKYTDF
jgi:hypothetical protein